MSKSIHTGNYVFFNGILELKVMHELAPHVI